MTSSLEATRLEPDCAGPEPLPQDLLRQTRWDVWTQADGHRRSRSHETRFRLLKLRDQRSIQTHGQHLSLAGSGRRSTVAGGNLRGLVGTPAQDGGHRASDELVGTITFCAGSQGSRGGCQAAGDDGGAAQPVRKPCGCGCSETACCQSGQSDHRGNCANPTGPGTCSARVAAKPPLNTQAQAFTAICRSCGGAPARTSPSDSQRHCGSDHQRGSGNQQQRARLGRRAHHPVRQSPQARADLG